MGSGTVERLNAALSGRYVVLRELGAGGMARVYLAKDLKHDREVALKVLSDEVASAVGADRFLRETRISARLSHPHILTLIDSGQAGDQLYLILPFVEGESLRERIDREGPLPVEEAVRIASQVAAALGYAHGEGVIHRDVKPSNVLLHRGEAMVADFGIATGMERTGDAQLTAVGSSIGSPGYMSPEQARGEAVDQRTDVWALGCVTYEMLCGESPFPGTAAPAVLAKVLTATPEPLESRRGDVPSGVAEAVRHALAKDPEERLQTVDELAAALSAALPTGGSERRATRTLAAAAMLVVAVAAGLWALQARAELGARNAVEAARAAIEEQEWIEAYRLVVALPDAVDDSVRAALLDAATEVDSVRSDPAGATVAWRPMLQPDAPWEILGPAPLEARLPAEPVLLRVALEGHTPRYAWSSTAAAEQVVLQPEDGDTPDGLWIPGGEMSGGVLGGGIWIGDRRTVGDYLLDRYEVTNEQFKRFVDAGGYGQRDLWEHPFQEGGAVLAWEDATALFVDRTGRPGPSTWELGAFEEGTARHPVTGVSWYEAAAYARFTDRSLPTLYHWLRAAFVQRGNLVVPLSNLPGDGPAPVGTFPGVTLAGAFDMAGNAREWTANAAGGLRLTQGGGWGDEAFAFGLGQPLPPMDRSELNGFRLMTDLGDPAMLAAAAAPMAYYERDFSEARPVGEDVFDAYRSVFAYDRTPLDATVESLDTVAPGIVRERITFAPAYAGQRMVVQLFRPAERSEARRPVVVYYPGAGAMNATRFPEGVTNRGRLVVTSGRMMAYPMVLGSFERQDDFEYPIQDETNAYRDHVVAWYRDVARTLDYLETRPDVDPEAFGYYGLSMGSRMGAFVLALEPRFRAAVLEVPGLSPKPTQAVVDPVNFLPRVRQPVLLLSGQYDPVYPLEISARPFFRLLGSPVKEHHISAGAHFVPWPELARRTLDWLDRYVPTDAAGSR